MAMATRATNMTVKSTVETPPSTEMWAEPPFVDEGRPDRGRPVGRPGANCTGAFLAHQSRFAKQGELVRQELRQLGRRQPLVANGLIRRCECAAVDAAAIQQIQLPATPEIGPKQRIHRDAEARLFEHLADQASLGALGVLE